YPALIETQKPQPGVEGRVRHTQTHTHTHTHTHTQHTYACAHINHLLSHTHYHAHTHTNPSAITHNDIRKILLSHVCILTNIETHTAPPLPQPHTHHAP